MITIDRTFNREFIKCFMSIPEIFDAVSEDGATSADFEPDVNGTFWLMVSSGDDVIALYHFHAINSITLMCHANMLTKYRKQYSGETAIKMFEWFLESGYKKLITNVPEIHVNVIRYLERFGFKNEGVNRKSYIKNGLIMDMVNFGITFDEVGEFLKCQQ